jgi:hypothetical protein
MAGPGGASISPWHESHVIAFHACDAKIAQPALQTPMLTWESGQPLGVILAVSPASKGVCKAVQNENLFCKSYE